MLEFLIVALSTLRSVLVHGCLSQTNQRVSTFLGEGLFSGVSSSIANLENSLEQLRLAGLARSLSLRLQEAAASRLTEAGPF